MFNDLRKRYHPPAVLLLPTTISSGSSNINMASNYSSRRRPAASGNAIKILAIFAIAIALAVAGVFVKIIPAKVSLISSSNADKALHGQERTWHGGHPVQDRPGSCWCGGDEYCMCTPNLAIDIVLYSRNDDDYSVWVVRRSDTGQLATIGGFVDVGETTESAVLRETTEESGIIIPPDKAKSSMTLIGVYSDPRRDNRRSIVSVAYALEFDPSIMTTKDGTNIPKAGDDAKEVISVSLNDVGVKYKGNDWYADHLTILLDFKEQVSQSASKDGSTVVIRQGELYDDVSRSVCPSIS